MKCFSPVICCSSGRTCSFETRRLATHEADRRAARAVDNELEAIKKQQGKLATAHVAEHTARQAELAEHAARQGGARSLI